MSSASCIHIGHNIIGEWGWVVRGGGGVGGGGGLDHGCLVDALDFENKILSIKPKAKNQQEQQQK